MRDFFDGYDEQPIDAGFKNEPLKADDYPMTLERIIRGQVSANGSIGVTCLMRVSEGPYERRTALITQYITAAVMRAQQDDEGNFIKEDGVLQREMRPDDEYESASAKSAARTRGIVHAFTGDSQARDTVHDAPTDNFPTEDNVAYYLDRTGINSCVGETAIVTLTLDREGRNGATRFKHVNDPKDGIAAWRSKTLPKQITRRERENPTAVAGAAL